MSIVEPDASMSITRGSLRRATIELYEEPARWRTLVVGRRHRLVRVRVPDVVIAKVTPPCAQTYRFAYVAILRRLGPGEVCVMKLPHGDAWGFVCVGGARMSLGAGVISASEAVWMTTFVDRVDEQTMFETWGRSSSLDEWVASLARL